MRSAPRGEEAEATPGPIGPGTAAASRIRAGTWMASMKETQAMDTGASQLLALTDSHLARTLTDLNTPDIKIEDSIAVSHSEVSSTSWDQKDDPFRVGFFAPPANASHTSDLRRDDLQEGHLGDSVCLMSFMNHDTDGDALQPVMTGLPDYWGQPQDSSTASLTPVGQAAAPTGGTTFETDDLDMSSFDEQIRSSDGSLPQFILDLIEKLNEDMPLSFGDPTEDVPADESKRFDMNLAQQSQSDLLQDAMAVSDLFPELEGYLDSHEDTAGGMIPIYEQFSPANEAVANWMETPPSSSGSAQQQLAAANVAPILATPSSSILDSGVSRVPRTPLKRQNSRLRLTITPTATPEPSATPSTSTGRPRRTSKKPVRFEETFDHAEEDLSMDVDYIPEEEPEASTSTANSRKRQRLSPAATEHMTAAEKYHRNRILNNEASKRCRLKKKTRTKELAEEEEELAQTNRELRARHQELKRKKELMTKLLNLLLQKKMENAAR